VDILKISYTQITTYMQCPARWWFRYVVGLKVPPTAALVWGKAVDRVLSHNYAVKMEKGTDEYEDVLEDMFTETYRAEAKEAIFLPDESPEKDEEVGRARIREYRRVVAPTIMPRGVQREYERMIGDIPMTGVVDVETEDEIIDIKTGSRAQSSISDGQRLQLELYNSLRPTPARRVSIHLLVRNETRSGNVIVLSAQPEADRRIVESVLSGVVKGIRHEVIYPNRAAPTCSRRWCGYWEICEKTYGGKVKP
jgi:CRISPR/Cas system-associated exonuclease Cas4 (RecB family)